jgi:transketolase
MLSKKKINILKNECSLLRKNTFENFILKKEAHLGGSFSMIEILIYIYGIKLNKKDKFILSKAHASFPLCILLRQKGYNPNIKTHLEIDEKNGIFCTTGSLGHGFPIGTGMALANKIKRKNQKTYVLISDGECQEGTTWESLLIAAKHKLNNLYLLIDYNKIQALQKIDDVLPLDNLKKKIKSFNWNCISVSNGHSLQQIDKAFNKKLKKNYPTAIIFNTIKGKGIKEFENDPVWHARKLETKEIEIGRKKLGIK